MLWLFIQPYLHQLYPTNIGLLYRIFIFIVIIWISSMLKIPYIYFSNNDDVISAWNIDINTYVFGTLFQASNFDVNSKLIDEWSD